MMPSPSIRGRSRSARRRRCRSRPTLPARETLPSSEHSMKCAWMKNAVVGTQVPDARSGRKHTPFPFGVWNVAHRTLLLEISITTRESMNACPSHSHRSAIGPDNPRFGAKCAIDPAATDQSKLGGRDSWTARWQKRTRREAFDCDDWFGGGIRRGPQSGCGQGSRIAGKQERSSSQVTLQLSPDLEVGGACAQQGGALARHRSGLECCRHDYPSARSARRAKA